ncbi:hypothetical protein ABVB69_26645 [Streptomyces sp. NPDC000349]|uniref:hypothetical protein n=1 Tax=unclassified Streptomyces TaxID=2593676 RepID=UPI002783995D|nr:hypothetical protein [Streptomyces sp. DSM 40167]MDQ0402774.1 hypothetical protein [Streptomyces sp. DSM 40167]
MQSGRAPASQAPLSRRRLFGLSAGAFLAAGCTGDADRDDRGNDTTGRPESTESGRPRAAAPDGALGANFNEDPTYVDKAALDGLGTSWVRGFTVLDRVKEGMAPERLRAVRALLDLHSQGFGTILALKFQFRKEGLTVPAPGTREMRAELAAVEKVLETVLDKVEILTLGNEPFLETRPQERRTKLNPFYQAVAKHVIDYRDARFPGGCRTRLHMGALNHLDDPAMLSDATEEWIAFVNRTVQLDGLDMHPHVTSAGAAQKYLDYVLPRLDRAKKFLVTEFSLVNHYQRQMPKPLPAPFLTAHGKELGLGRDTRVWQFLKAAAARPLTEEQWRDFLRMSPWFEDHKHFMRDQVTAYRETGRLAVATYGVVQGKASVRDITEKTKPWMLNSLYVPRTVRHERGAPLPRSYTVSDDFAALQREQDRLPKR